MTSLPLEGVRVIDIGTMTAGPYCGRFLGDLGAEVIKVEPLKGEVTRNLSLKFGGTGYLFHVNNYNKKSFALNVQEEKDKKTFLQLVSESDVLIENFAKGTMDKWGLGFEHCKEANPHLIYCSITGFGHEGRLKDKRAYDTVVQSLAGIMHTTGDPDYPPVKGGPSICDLFAATAALNAISIALWDKKKKSAQHIDVSMMEGAIWTLLSLWPYVLKEDFPPLNRIGNSHWDHVPYGNYSCKDGSIFITVKTQAHWAGLAKLLDLPQDWDVQQRNNQRKMIEQKLEFLKDLDVWEAAGKLQQEGIPAAPVLGLDKVSSLEHVKLNQNIISVSHPEYGEIPLINSPLAVGKQVRNKIRLLPPTIGEHNEEIMRRLGLNGS